MPNDWRKTATTKNQQGGVLQTIHRIQRAWWGEEIPPVWFHAFDSLSMWDTTIGPAHSKKKKERKRENNPPLCYRNVSLCVGAPVRVNLRGLVRRLLYSHLTPSTLSSPSPPPSSVLQCTPILTLPLPPTTSLHGWICLVLRSTHVCCLPWRVKERR